MIKQSTFLYILSIVLLFSCKKEEASDPVPLTEPEIPEIIIPENQELDLDMDGEMDLSINYLKHSTLEYPMTAYSAIGSFTPYDHTSFLYKTNKNYLFLESGDIIRSIPENDQLQWFNYPADVISKGTSSINGIDENWTILSEKETFYLAFKLHPDAILSMGYLKLSLDINTGEISIVDRQIFDIEEIIVE